VYLLLCAIVFPEPDVSLKDLERFPPLPEVKKILPSVRAQQELIEKLLRSTRNQSLGKEDRQRLENYAEWQSKNLDSWCALAMAQGYCDCMIKGKILPLRLRIDYLRYLRKLLGPEAYRKGNMPPPPTWLQ
jgi:hypothetical protein